MMRIGMVTASVSRQAGGNFDALRGLALGLHRPPDLAVRVLGLDDGHTEADRAAWGVLPVGAFPVRGPQALGYAPGLAARLRAEELDLIHAHGLWMYPSRASLNWARRRGRPHVISPHGMLDPWALARGRLKKRLAGWLYEDAHLRRAACLHALSEQEAHCFRAIGLKAPICVIPNGIDLPGTALPPPPAWRRAVPAEAKVLLYLGRLHPKKGLAALLKAWSRVADQAQAGEWWLAVAGWDQQGHEGQLKHLAEALGLDRIRFIGPQFGADKAATLRAADAFVLPSESEGLPMAVLEAWAYRLPVLMTPQCNLSVGFAAGAALSMAPETEAIARALAELFVLRSLERGSMGAAGRGLVERHYAWPRVAEQMRAVYRWLLGGGARPACILAA